MNQNKNIQFCSNSEIFTSDSTGLRTMKNEIFFCQSPTKRWYNSHPPPADAEAVGTFSCSYETNYEANNAIVDVPMKQDLASDKTLDMLLSYSETLADNVLKQKNEEEEDYPPIMSVISPYLLGDGNPIWGIYKQLKREGGSSKYKRKMPVWYILEDFI